MLPRSRLLAGDVARLLRETLGLLYGSVVLMTLTAPGEIEVCPCCGEVVPERYRVKSDADVAGTNRDFSRRLRRLNGRIRVEMWRMGLRPPRVVAWVKQLQARGVLHQHGIALARSADERERIRVYVALYRSLHVRYGLGYIDDPFKVRRGGRDAVFERAGIAGNYLGKYLGGGQLEAALVHEERAAFGKLWWVSPVLLARSGWSLARCRWVRQAYRLRNGGWKSKTWYGDVAMPSWWFHGEHRAWVLAVVGWDGQMPGKQ